MQLDETSRAIVNCLKDGRTPYKQIAEELSIAEGTVRSRVKKLREEGVFEITGLVDPDAIQDQSVVMIGVKVKDMDLVKKGEEFSTLRGVTSVCVVTGQYDLIVTVSLNRDFTILDFYTEEASKISNIRSVETFVVYKSFNLKLPLVA